MSTDLIEKVRVRFVDDTAKHVMDVIRDDGLYRHLRFKQPGSTFYYHDLITWPGYLAIVGDAGDYLFSRTRDMFEFFASDSGRINPHYWGEKLQGPRNGRDNARSYSHDAFRARLYEWCQDEGEWGGIYPSLLRGAVDRELLHDWTHSEHEARERLDYVDCDTSIFGDSWEWDLREYDHQFLWCCWAIARGIQRYRQLPRPRDYSAERGFIINHEEA